MPVGPPSSPSGVFLLSEAFSFEKAPVQVPSELPKVSETFLICPLMFGSWIGSDGGEFSGRPHGCGPRPERSGRRGHPVALVAISGRNSALRAQSITKALQAAMI